jgi:hypothetical protein
MHRKFRSILAFILAMLMIAATFVSCGGDPVESSPESDTEQETVKETESESETESETEEPAKELLWPTLLSNKRQKYKIVIPDKAGLVEITSAYEVSSMLKEASGVFFTYETDIITWQGIPDRYELVIGNTNREETAAAKLQLSEDNPYVITEIGKRIVITAICDKYLVSAVNAFLMDYVGDTSDRVISEEPVVLLPLKT